MNKILIDKEFLNKQKCEPSKEFGFIPCSFRGFDGLELIIAGDVPKNFALGIVNCKNVIIKTFSYEKSIIECISMNDSYNIEVQNVCFNELNLEKGKNIIFNNCDFIQVQNEREETHRKNNDPFSWFLRITNCEALFLLSLIMQSALLNAVISARQLFLKFFSNHSIMFVMEKVK